MQGGGGGLDIVNVHIVLFVLGIVLIVLVDVIFGDFLLLGLVGLLLQLGDLRAIVVLDFHSVVRRLVGLLK